MRYLLCLVLLSSLRCVGQNALPGIGLWREHLPYQVAQDVTASDKTVYCATPYSLFSVDLRTNETQRFSKVSGLSETGISTICYDAYAGKLVIAYTNSNIDLLGQNNISNVPGLKRATVTGDKNVYQIYPDPTYCYLSTGLGVVLLDPDKNEIHDTWFIGNGGGAVRTNGFSRDSAFYYAATEEGLKRAPVNTAFPGDFHNWETVSGSNLLPAGPCKMVLRYGSNLIALEKDSLFIQRNNQWSLFFANGWPVTSVTVSGNVLLLCERKASGEAQVLALDQNGAISQALRKTDVIALPRSAVQINSDYWVADLAGGLSRWTGNAFQEQYKLNSPEGIATGQMLAANDILYATAGSVNDAWNYQYNPGGIFQFKDGYWTSYNKYHFSALDSMLDFIAIAIDPRDGSIWGGSYGGGLLHIKANDQLEIFKQQSPLAPTVGDPASYRVAGLAFDNGQNLWVSNFGAGNELHVLKSNGQWASFSIPYVLNVNAAAQIVVDDADQEWIVSPLNNGLIAYNHGQHLDNPADDQWRIYKAGVGNGNLPANGVNCIAKDRNGFIWVGTDDGMAVIQCPQDAFANTSCEAVLPIIQDGSFANYLFKGVRIRSIAVDGANRKWVATPDGAWLVGEDGDRVLAHFTEDNSPLLSSDVRSIAINGKTGEVFFGTAFGICSYRGTATEASAPTNNVLVFPNPVPPGYQGTIAIRGLPENSFVKIVETGGRLVYQTRSLGGQAVWNGRDYRGRPIASGIYIVIAEDENKQQKAVTKIVFISK